MLYILLLYIDIYFYGLIFGQQISGPDREIQALWNQNFDTRRKKGYYFFQDIIIPPSIKGGSFFYEG
jgi:hypothetical protein